MKALAVVIALLLVGMSVLVWIDVQQYIQG